MEQEINTADGGIKKTINQDEANRVRAWILELKDQTNVRDDQIQQKKERMKAIAPYWDEYFRLEEEVGEMRTEQKEQDRLLKTLIDFAEKASGEKFVDEGPLFNNEEGSKGAA